MMPNQFLRLLASFCALCLLASGPLTDAKAQGEKDVSADQSARDTQTKLDLAVRTYRSQLEPGKRRLFDLSQKRWEAYRRAACDFQASAVAGGSAQPMVLAYCMADLANERLKLLSYLLTCEEGDLSCPESRHDMKLGR